MQYQHGYAAGNTGGVRQRKAGRRGLRATDVVWGVILSLVALILLGYGWHLRSKLPREGSLGSEAGPQAGEYGGYGLPPYAAAPVLVSYAFYEKDLIQVCGTCAGRRWQRSINLCIACTPRSAATWSSSSRKAGWRRPAASSTSSGCLRWRGSSAPHAAAPSPSREDSSECMRCELRPRIVCSLGNGATPVSMSGPRYPRTRSTPLPADPDIGISRATQVDLAGDDPEPELEGRAMIHKYLIRASSSSH